jgi:hypothetical protein
LAAWRAPHERKIARVIFAADLKRHHMVNVDCVLVDYKVYLLLADETVAVLRIGIERDVSGALNPTSRTFGFMLQTRIVSPSITRTSSGYATNAAKMNPISRVMAPHSIR